MSILSDDHDAPPDMQDCIDACTNCHQACWQTAMTHCLKMGGAHVAPDHFRLMMDCAEICAASAKLQLAGSRYSASLCALCAEVCHDCAISCMELDGMEECVRACEHCERGCREMAEAV